MGVPTRRALGEPGVGQPGWLPGQCWPTCPWIKGTLGERPGLRVPGRRDPSSKRLGVALPSGVREKEQITPLPTPGP